MESIFVSSCKVLSQRDFVLEASAGSIWTMPRLRATPRLRVQQLCEEGWRSLGFETSSRPAIETGPLVVTFGKLQQSRRCFAILCPSM